jgi:uncharacterized coiled-coil protein SlyX
MYALESDCKLLQSRVSELESIVASQAEQLETMAASKALLLDKYNVLKKSAAQLESFRKVRLFFGFFHSIIFAYS